MGFLSNSCSEPYILRFFERGVAGDKPALPKIRCPKNGNAPSLKYPISIGTPSRTSILKLVHVAAGELEGVVVQALIISPKV